jgi:cobalt/nickel transport system ATP-binding protein
LQVQKGRRLAILGANGSGKTTLLLHLNGTFRPTAGEIRMDGQPASYDRRSLIHWRRRVGLVLQEPDDQLFAATVEQDVSFGPLNLGVSELRLVSG